MGNVHANLHHLPMSIQQAVGVFLGKHPLVLHPFEVIIDQGVQVPLYYLQRIQERWQEGLEREVLEVQDNIPRIDDDLNVCYVYL